MLIVKLLALGMFFCIVLSVVTIHPFNFPKTVEKNITFIKETHAFEDKVQELVAQIIDLYQRHRPVHCAIYNLTQLSTYECGSLEKTILLAAPYHKEEWRTYRNTDIDAVIKIAVPGNVSTVVTIVGGNFAATLYYLYYLLFAMFVSFLQWVRDIAMTIFRIG